jgi:hypothetical protein
MSSGFQPGPGDTPVTTDSGQTLYQETASTAALQGEVSDAAPLTDAVNDDFTNQDPSDPVTQCPLLTVQDPGPTTPAPPAFVPMFTGNVTDSPPPPPGKPVTGGTSTTPAPLTPQTPKTDTPITVNVTVPVTETITNGTPTSWNNTYKWDSKFKLDVDKKNCTVTATVRIKVNGTVTEAQKTAWQTAIQNKWNNKVRFTCSGTSCKGFAVSVAVQYVTSGQDYTVNAQTPGASDGGRSGLGGTTGMTGWGVNDTTDTTHEFGHMLGNVEEYFTTNGVDYSDGGKKLPFRDPHGGIMNNPANDPLPANYDTIRQQTAKALGKGTTCTTN